MTPSPEPEASSAATQPAPNLTSTVDSLNVTATRKRVPGPTAVAEPKYLLVKVKRPLSTPSADEIEAERTLAKRHRKFLSRRRRNNADTYAGMVTVLVGPEEEDFSFDQGSLVLKSSYFEKALEKHQSVLRLPNLSAKYFKMYWHWVYEPRLDYKALGYCPSRNPRFVDLHINPPTGMKQCVMAAHQIHEAEEPEVLADSLVRLWFLGDFLGDVKLQNIVADELATWYVDCGMPSSISESTIAYVEEHTAAGTVEREHLLRQLCIDWADRKFREEEDMLEFSRTAPRWMTSGLLYNKTQKEWCMCPGKWWKVPMKGSYHL